MKIRRSFLACLLLSCSAFPATAAERKQVGRLCAVFIFCAGKLCGRVKRSDAASGAVRLQS